MSTITDEVSEKIGESQKNSDITSPTGTIPKDRWQPVLLKMVFSVESPKNRVGHKKS